MRLFDTLTGREHEFKSLDGKVRIYVCGITPYAPCHMGHAMSYVIFDTLVRYLEFQGYEVDHVQNFTDIDDKIIERSAQEGVAPAELAEKYIQQFYTDMDSLNIRRAKVYPRATHEIPDIIKIIDSLISKGYAYVSDNSVYYRVSMKKDYGKLSHRKLNEMIPGSRVEVELGKENPMDFTLWKASKPGEPSWESPWGPGRPGWHIECSAMALRYLGQTVDIHGGGQDLVFPHHENEISQSEAHTDITPFARFWVHNGLLNFGEDKMSKSLGNLITVSESLTSYSADAVRIFILSSHYRSPLKYIDGILTSNERAAERLRNALRHDGPDYEGIDPSPFEDQFVQAMDADLNTPQALATLFDLSREINKTASIGGSVKAAQKSLIRLGGILGLTFRSTDQEQGDNNSKYLIDMIVNVRMELRLSKQFELSDRIRDSLERLGIVIEDIDNGTEWRYR